MITTRDRIVAGEAMRHETVRRSAVALDRKRTIFCAVSRPRHERFAVGYITTEGFGDLVDRGKLICWHGTGGERAGRSPASLAIASSVKKVALRRAGCHELLSAGAVLPAPGRFISVMAVASRAGRLSR